MALPLPVTPAEKLLRVRRGITFNFPLQYTTANGPVNLDGFIGYWKISWTASQLDLNIPLAQSQLGQIDAAPLRMQTSQFSNSELWTNNPVTLTNTTPVVIGQPGLSTSTAGRIQPGIVGSSALIETSGVYLSANGIINLILSASDTAALLWKTATYSLLITDPVAQQTNELLVGAMTTFV